MNYLGEGHCERGLVVVRQVPGRDLPGADVDVGHPGGVVHWPVTDAEHVGEGEAHDGVPGGDSGQGRPVGVMCNEPRHPSHLVMGRGKGGVSYVGRDLIYDVRDVIGGVAKHIKHFVEAKVDVQTRAKSKTKRQ